MNNSRSLPFKADVMKLEKIQRMATRANKEEDIFSCEHSFVFWGFFLMKKNTLQSRELTDAKH